MDSVEIKIDEINTGVHIIEEHIHAITELWPLLAIPVELEKAAGIYAAFPAPTEIIPAGSIGLIFDIHWAVVSAISANGDFILRLLAGVRFCSLNLS